LLVFIPHVQPGFFIADGIEQLAHIKIENLVLMENFSQFIFSPTTQAFHITGIKFLTIFN
jgi:rhamnose utilization protein RhaD (predicted bifunctional aldolase and dehydrogenase)